MSIDIHHIGACRAVFVACEVCMAVRVVMVVTLPIGTPIGFGRSMAMVIVLIRLLCERRIEMEMCTHRKTQSWRNNCL